ncbi:MAG: CHRD domain-containing protein [Acidimicrobiia bacterium]|nr:CHRD domain-containing protein [Acidimicrobiia bacterium]
MRRILMMVAAVAMLVVMAVPASAAGPDFVVELTGEQEVGGGDPDGFGIARLDFDRANRELCFDVDVFNVDDVTGIHIHDGDVGVNGPIVIDFEFATNGFEGCVSVDRAVLREILRNPAGFYVNVHSVEFPGGAVRGQLA